MERINKQLDRFRKLIEKSDPERWVKIGFTLIPNKVIKGSGFSNSEFRVYVDLLMRSFGKGWCKVSQNTIANDIGLRSKSSRVTVLNNIGSLAKKGFLESKRVSGSTSIYKPLVVVDRTGVVDKRVNKNLHPP